MKMRRIMKENKGYSLVEMIIVIAIIAVLSGAAMVTISLINSAKAKEAAVSIESELAALVARAKSQVPKFDDGSGEIKPQNSYNFAITIYQNADDNKFYIADGYYKVNSSGKKVFVTTGIDLANSGKGVSISSKVSVGYIPGIKNSGVVNDDDIFPFNAKGDNKWIIAYDKSGRCICGVGTYEINKKPDNSTVDEICINANGSHVSK